MADADSRKNTPVLTPGEQASDLCPLGLMLSEQRRIAWCNRRFAQLFAYPVEALIGQSLALLYPSAVEFQRIGERGHQRMQESGSYQDERLMRLCDGSLQWFRVHGQALDRSAPFASASWVFEPLAAGLDAQRLTPRQREVLADMARGLTAKESGRELGLSPRTVEKQRAELRERFGASNAAELMRRVSGLPE